MSRAKEVLDGLKQKGIRVKVLATEDDVLKLLSRFKGVRGGAAALVEGPSATKASTTGSGGDGTAVLVVAAETGAGEDGYQF